MSNVFDLFWLAFEEIEKSDPAQERYDEEGNLVCFYCGVKLDKESVDGRYPVKDHFLAKSRGGLSRPWNLVMACQRCNGVKSNKHFLRWLGSDRINLTDEAAYKLLALTMFALMSEVHQLRESRRTKRQLVKVAQKIFDLLGDEHREEKPQ